MKYPLSAVLLVIIFALAASLASCGGPSVISVPTGRPNAEVRTASPAGSPKAAAEQNSHLSAGHRHTKPSPSPSASASPSPSVSPSPSPTPTPSPSPSPTPTPSPSPSPSPTLPPSVYVPNNLNNTITVYDQNGNQIATSGTLTSQPVGIAFDSTNGYLYVTYENIDTITVYDQNLNQIPTTGTFLNLNAPLYLTVLPSISSFMSSLHAAHVHKNH